MTAHSTRSLKFMTRLHKNREKPPQGHQKECESKEFKRQTLKLMHEQTFGNLFGTSALDTFEASGVTAFPGGDGIYAVLDNSFSIARIGSSLGKFSWDRQHELKPDALMQWEGKRGKSQFEYMAYNASSGHYIVGQEATEMEDGSLRSATFDVTFEGNKVKVWEICTTDFSFGYMNKGFEGGWVVTGTTGRSFLLGLCEGNYCSGSSQGKKSGHGRIIMMERSVKNGKCILRTVDEVKLGRDIDFQDYSAITVWNGSRIGIASQENSAVFIGDLKVGEESVEIGEGRMYDFPRNDRCEIKYCNIEGLYFLEEHLVVAVSDSMKGKRRQPHRCREKDESVHVFQIPS